MILAAGNSVELVNPGTPNLRVEIVAPDNEAINLGTITAEAGRIGIYAGLIRSSGGINADRAVIGPGGNIILQAGGDVIVSGLITARDGNITVENLTLGGNGVVDGNITQNGNIAVGGYVTLQGGNATVTGNITAQSASPIPQSLTAGAQALLENIRTNEIIQRASAGILSLQGMVLPTTSLSGVLHAPVTTPSLQFDIKRNQGVTR